MKLTDRAFWEKYWLEKGDSVYQEINENYLFHDVFTQFLPKENLSLLEIGGFPGYFSIFFAKHLEYTPTILDFYINHDILDKLCSMNQVPKLNIIEADLLNCEPVSKFDVVMSLGLIEHFDNPDKIIKHHLKFLKKDGYLIIELPNFRGINGLVQWFFDKENLNAHNTEIMHLKYMEDLFKEHGLQLIYSQYYGNFGVWLEQIEQRDKPTQILLKTLNFFGNKLIPMPTRYFSPFMLLIARY